MVQASASIDGLFQRALSLAPEQRAELAYLLIDSVVGEPTEAGYDEYWQAELERQNAELAAGTADLVSLDEARTQMFGPRG